MSKKKKKQNKPAPDAGLFYETIGDTVSPGRAYLQAATLLDMAAIMAVESSNPEALGSVAHQWMEMAVLMSGGKPHHDDDDPVTETRILGFGSTETREVAEKDAREKARLPR